MSWDLQGNCERRILNGNCWWIWLNNGYLSILKHKNPRDLLKCNFSWFCKLRKYCFVLSLCGHFARCPCVYVNVLYSSNVRCVSVFCFKLRTVKETPQTTDEEVGAFTKLIEAMGFTGPLKYNKWVNKSPHLVLPNSLLLNNPLLIFDHLF